MLQVSEPVWNGQTGQLISWPRSGRSLGHPLQDARLAASEVYHLGAIPWQLCSDIQTSCLPCVSPVPGSCHLWLAPFNRQLHLDLLQGPGPSHLVRHLCPWVYHGVEPWQAFQVGMHHETLCPYSDFNFYRQHS